jgi:hypothetical protein
MRPAKKAPQPVFFTEEKFFGSVPLGPKEEIRVSTHAFRGKIIVNIRKHRLIRSGWVHTTIGIMLGSVVFLDLLDALAALAIELEVGNPETESTSCTACKGGCVCESATKGGKRRKGGLASMVKNEHGESCDPC